MSQLHLGTWNVRGIHNPGKGKKLLYCLILPLLHKTHLNQQEHLLTTANGQVFPFTSKSTGVAVLIKKNFPFKGLITIQHSCGLYLILTGLLYGMTVSLMNISFPPGDPSSFRTKYLQHFLMSSDNVVVAASDFNCLLNALIDKFPHKRASPSPLAKLILGICDDLDYIDVWRILHTSKKEYTFSPRPINAVY